VNLLSVFVLTSTLNSSGTNPTYHIEFLSTHTVGTLGDFNMQ